MSANRTMKASVFSSFFSEPARAIEVYNAAAGTDYAVDTPIEFNTLEDVLFKNRMNDISFLLDGKLIVLIEHQSMLNDNMALRMLLYIGRLYEKLLNDNSSIYREKRIALAAPQFIVMYNGAKAIPQRSQQKLSEAFSIGQEEAKLELTVDVFDIGIHEGEPEPGILQESESLKEYSTFVHEVNYGLQHGKLPFDQAVSRAIRVCIQRDIMKGFLQEHGAEVENMLYTEWNIDDMCRVAREEGWEDGLEQGMERGLEQGMEQGMKQGREAGESLFAQLIRCLITDQRMGDVELVTKDKNARLRLYQEYKLQ